MLLDGVCIGTPNWHFIKTEGDGELDENGQVKEDEKITFGRLNPYPGMENEASRSNGVPVRLYYCKI
jgi:hypothetical protein